MIYYSLDIFFYILIFLRLTYWNSFGQAVFTNLTKVYEFYLWKFTGKIYMNRKQILTLKKISFVLLQ